MFISFRHIGPEYAQPYKTTPPAFRSPAHESSQRRGRKQRVPIPELSSSDDCGDQRMQEVEKYRQFAKECHRLAALANPSDKEILLTIAKAWEDQAKIAEGAVAKKNASKPDGSGIAK